MASGGLIGIRMAVGKRGPCPASDSGGSDGRLATGIAALLFPQGDGRVDKGGAKRRNVTRQKCDRQQQN